MFDEGELQYDYEVAEQVCNSLLEPFVDNGNVTPGRLRIVEAHDVIANEIIMVNSDKLTIDCVIDIDCFLDFVQWFVALHFGLISDQ